MANTQQATSAVMQTLDSSKLSQTTISLNQLSISQLLGRDYLFVDFSDIPQPDEKTFNECLESFFDDLGLTHSETLVVSLIQTLDGNVFSRHELTWLSNKIRRHDVSPIAQTEQQAFMQMIWQCTTPIHED